MIVVETFIACDNCGETFGVDSRANTGAKQRIKSKDNGWKFYNGRDYCPNCLFCTPAKKETKGSKRKH